MHTVHLVRHGQASFGSADYDRLSELGERQARTLGTAWRCEQRNFHQACSGSMARQRDTARHLLDALGLAALPYRIEPALNEYDAEQVFERFFPRLLRDRPEMARRYRDTPDILIEDRSFLREAFSAALRLWIGADPGELQGLESFSALVARVRNGLQEIAATAPAGTESLLVTSTGVICIAVALGQGMPEERALELIWEVRNASHTELRIEAGQIHVERFNDTRHFDRLDDDTLISFL